MFSIQTKTTWVAIAALNSLVASVVAQAYTATYLPYDAPDSTEQGQSGTNAVFHFSKIAGCSLTEDQLPSVWNRKQPNFSLPECIPQLSNRLLLVCARQGRRRW